MKEFRSLKTTILIPFVEVKQTIIKHSYESYFSWKLLRFNSHALVFTKECICKKKEYTMFSEYYTVFISVFYDVFYTEEFKNNGAHSSDNAIRQTWHKFQPLSLDARRELATSSDVIFNGCHFICTASMSELLEHVVTRRNDVLFVKVCIYCTYQTILSTFYYEKYVRSINDWFFGEISEVKRFTKGSDLYGSMTVSSEDRIV